MEKSSNIEDQVMDHLLRSYVKQQRPSEGTCQGFDADVASLYLERVLTEKETSHYEIHLAKCSPCRSSMVALARFAEQEIPLAISAPAADPKTLHSVIEADQKTLVESSASWLARLQALLSVFATPRFALAAVAALVLAISIPFVISQKGNNAISTADKVPDTNKSLEEKTPGVIAQAPSPNPGVLLHDGASKDQAVPADSKNSSVPESANHPSPSPPAVATGEASGATGASPPATEIATARENKKEEEKRDAALPAENRSRSDDAAGAGRASEPPVPRAAAPSTPESSKVAATERKELQRIEKEEALKIPQKDKDAAAKTIKPGTSNDIASDNKPKGATIRPGDPSVQPPASSSESSSRKGVVAGKSKSAYRDESDVSKERARASASRKIDNKTFWLLDDIWTDKDYKKDKELPVVTLIKDSDVYQEVFEKRSSLQKFFKGFAANEKVIIVYKGTVYRVIPRDGN